MNGPDHYYAAERLLQGVEEDADEGYTDVSLALQRVMAHAILALTAATVHDAVGLATDGQTAGEWRTAVTR